MRLSIIVAMDDKQLIGKNNALPWHLPADLGYFKKTTTGKTVLMGRKTYDSIGKPLSGRRNIILSRTSNKSKNRETYNSIREALDACKQDNEVMIIGGVSIYNQFLNPKIDSTPTLDMFEVANIDTDISLVDRLYITQIEGTFDGDAYFPKFNQDDFDETSRESHAPDEKNPYTYHFIILDRKK
ncbi:Dihydrofolate reductase (EC 1.5.1.3) [uncultured Gammaproteobacteria bacterium]|jgi:dihydrofolate reductase|nr:Dihydrofolate reductase (EC 1.5.1.3) [uncultured Gammaproteobacteria bacterium]